MKNKILKFYYNLLGFLANKYVKKHKPYVIGVNGSVGKTSSRMIIYQTLYKFLDSKMIYTSSKNFNGELGLSLSIFQIEEFSPSIFVFLKTFFVILFKFLFSKKPYDILILEYGIDTPGEMDFLLDIVKPHVGLFTAIDSVHSMQFGDPSKIAKEESKMIKETLEFAFLNQDDNYALELKDYVDIDYLTYQTQGHDSGADIKFFDENFVLKNDKLLAEFKLKVKDKEILVSTNMIGKAHYGYIGVSLAILDIVNYKYGNTSIFDKFDKVFLDYKLQAGRFSVFEGIGNSMIFDSTYNSSPLSVQKILNTVHNIKNQLYKDSKIRVALGDMRELGDLTESEHRKIAAYVHSIADRVFLIGDSMKKYFYDELTKIGFNQNLIEQFDDAIELGEHVKKEIRKSNNNVLVVLKGSQNTIFLEEATKLLLKNEEDINNLTRQSFWWMNKKSDYFLSK